MHLKYEYKEHDDDDTCTKEDHLKKKPKDVVSMDRDGKQEISWVQKNLKPFKAPGDSTGGVGVFEWISSENMMWKVQPATMQLAHKKHNSSNCKTATTQWYACRGNWDGWEESGAVPSEPGPGGKHNKQTNKHIKLTDRNRHTVLAPQSH